MKAKQLTENPSPETPEAPTFQELLEKLSIGEQSFLIEYLVDFNSKNASQRAGKCDNYGFVILQKPDVSAALAAAVRERAAAAGIRADELLAEMRIIAFSDVTAYEVDDFGRPIKTPGNAHLWRAVKTIKFRKRRTRDGTETYETEIALWDKVAVLGKIAQHLGLLDGEGRSAEDRPPIVVVGVDMDDIARRAAAAKQQQHLALMAPVDAEIIEPTPNPSTSEATPPLHSESSS